MRRYEQAYNYKDITIRVILFLQLACYVKRLGVVCYKLAEDTTRCFVCCPSVASVSSGQPFILEVYGTVLVCWSYFVAHIKGHF